MTSVTKRIKNMKQPRGGFVPPKSFSKTVLNDKTELRAEEGISPILVGLSIDYLTRFMLGAEKEDAFKISLMGSMRAGEIFEANDLLEGITGLDDTSIINACKVVGFDVCYRKGMIGYKPVEEINPDGDTIHNVRVMVERSLSFFKEYGPVTKDGFSFEGAYTKLISIGDGDFLTEDTLWDFKVSKKEPDKDDTLQLLVYYLMGIRTDQKEFKSIKKLGVYNPRMNAVYVMAVEDIPKDVIDTVSSEVIGY